MERTHSRRRLEAAARRESILAAALPEFARSGYERTRVADIAARVGITEPVVFQNFGTKAALFGAVLERAAEQVEAHLAGLQARTQTVPELLARLLSPEHLDQLHGSGGLGTIFAQAAQQAHPEIRKAAQRAHRQTIQAVANLMRRGQEQGAIRDDVEPAILAGLVLSQIHAREFLREHVPGTSSALDEQLLTAVLDIVKKA